MTTLKWQSLYCSIASRTHKSATQPKPYSSNAAKDKIILQTLQHIIHASYCISTFVEGCLFFIVQIEFEDLFPAVFSDDNRYPEAYIFLSILAIKTYTARKQFF